MYDHKTKVAGEDKLIALLGCISFDFKRIVLYAKLERNYMIRAI